jgi:hypothetical protein
MNVKRILLGTLHMYYASWQKPFHLSIHRKWGGKLIYFEFSKFCVYLDIRKNWIEDMITGKIK